MKDENQTDTSQAPVSEASYPWEQGGKTPDQYTWEEYEELTPQQAEAFYDWFGSADAFEIWMNGSGESGQRNPWEQGGKTPDQYTWEEYEELTPQQAEAFYDWFGSADAFEIWMNGSGESGQLNPWEQGGKTPDQYTWEEYEELTPQQAEAFYDWFGSADAFETWMNGSGESGQLNPWEQGGKTPDQYTWEEYEQLTPQQAEAFYDWFGSVDAFDIWLNSAQGS